MGEENVYERYDRQLILKGFGAVAQDKLRHAKVLVIGAGGLGCPALQYLVAAGVGTVGLVDDDVVSLSNLHRQVLYETGDVGLKKVDVAAKKLAALNLEVAVIGYPFRLQNVEALTLFPQYDLVIDGTDNFASRYLINDACVLLRKPLVYGAVSQYQGQVAVFNLPGENDIAINYRHLFPEPPKDGEVANCAEAGVLGVLPGIIGTMQAAEAIKLITGIGKPLLNRLLTYDLLSNIFYEIETTATNQASMPTTREEFLAVNYVDVCAAAASTVKEIDAKTFHALRCHPSSLVIDVREEGELPLLKNISHKRMPLSNFEQEIKNIREKTILLLCQHGKRSLLAAEMMKKEYGEEKEIYSLSGGVAKWSNLL